MADEATNTYVFDKAVTFQNPDGKTSTGFIDLYRKGTFVCETKQSVARPEKAFRRRSASRRGPMWSGLWCPRSSSPSATTGKPPGRQVSRRPTQADLEHMERTVDPKQFRGIEINPRAVAIAEVVLWIGWLQWHLRDRKSPDSFSEPILQAYGNIECRDALLEYDKKELVRDEAGIPVTRWDGVTTKKHPVTGEDVPDDSARVAVERFVNPRKAEWPKADLVVGNPPFLGKLRIQSDLGEGYAEALRTVYADEVPDSADYVMDWWDRGARLVSAGAIRRFGCIKTNSITQSFNRRIVASALGAAVPCRVAFAVPDHPWVATEDGAAVRIAMTV